tara:strand:- start:11361 stop:11609 length:249 start_codon:yes stop_codon:yes gene_type:complete
MIGIIFSVLKAIIKLLLKTAALNFLRPHLLKLDKWCEEKIGIDIIKQEKKWFEKHPLLLKRIEDLEQETLTIAGKLEKLEKK